MTQEEFYHYCSLLPVQENGCRLWDRGLFDKGYPSVWLDKRNERGHRIMLVMKLGRPIRPGMMALHTCDTPRCVAEEHLYEGTAKQNTEDAITRKRFPVGDAHHARRTPWVMSRGDRHYARTNPEKLSRGDQHWKRKKRP